MLSARSLEKLEKSPRDIFHPEIQKGSVNFNFGVLCAKDGQLTDDEIFSHVFAGALLTQALGETSFGFLLSHWELPSLVASGEFTLSPYRTSSNHVRAIRSSLRTPGGGWVTFLSIWAGKDSRIPVVRLSAAREDTETVKIIRSKCDCRGNKLERTKGCLCVPLILTTGAS
uniref:GTPase-activating Rap/Ran-GAP domain-like protein 3 isoform X2 n=1 Tax=Agelaius phoeniceus TaxID=39638 RepID=UPI0023EBE6B7|nr:GTPase-activating Rap/Ran-GAP domain-like protein 3 isoform X2 [Agelaius phoeniceus]